MENANMQVKRQSWGRSSWSSSWSRSCSCKCRQRGQLIVAARPTMLHAPRSPTKSIEEFRLATLSVLATKPPPQLLPNALMHPRLPFATHTLALSAIEFCGNWRKVQQTLTKMLLANLVGRGRQAAPHAAHAAHEAQMKRYQVRQAEAATHTCHTHSPNTHSMQKERWHERGAGEEAERCIAIEALSLCGCRRSRVASNSYKGAKESYAS